MVLTDSLRCPWCYTDWHGLPRGKCLGSHNINNPNIVATTGSPNSHVTAWATGWGNWY